MLQPVARTRAMRQALPVLPETIAYFDLSLTGTGAALFHEGRIVTEHWQPKKPYDRGMVRLQWLHDKIAEYLTDHHPTIIAVEGYSFGSKNSRAHSIGEWGGIAKLVIMKRHVVRSTRTFIASPATVKKFMSGNSNAPKSEMPLRLFQRYGIDIAQEDEADAACGSILIGAHCYAGNFPALTTFQREALDGVEVMA